MDDRGASPKKNVLLFVHGWWGGAWVWDRFISHFSGLGYECHALDLKGASNSTSLDVGGISFDDHLAEVRDAVSSFDSPILIGHSAGGLLVQKLLESVRLPAAVLVGSSAPRGIFGVRSWQLLRAAARHSWAMLMHRPFLPGRREMNALNLNRMPAAEQAYVYDRMVPASGRQGLESALFAAPVDELRVDTPILVVNGGDDRLTPPSLARAIAKKYSAGIHEYPGNAHYLMREPNWQTIADDIDNWLKRVPSLRTGK